jgi:hypothetical protein
MIFSDWISGLVIIGFSVFVFVQTAMFPDLDNQYLGPSFFPNVVAGILFLLGLILSIKGGIRLLKKEDRLFSTFISATGYKNLLITNSLIVLYILLAEKLTFLISGFLLVFVLMKVLGSKTATAIIASAITVGIVYTLFVKILLVPLPVYVFEI